MLEYLIEVAARVRSASAIVFDTFDELERNAMNGLSSMLLKNDARLDFAIFQLICHFTIKTLSNQPICKL